MNRSKLGSQADRAMRRRGLIKDLRGRGGLVTFLAIAGVLGVASGFALATPTINGADNNSPDPCTLPNTTTTETRINEPSDNETTSVQVLGGATLTFVFNGDHTSATWTADAPFTGTIIVKAGSEQSGGGEPTFTFNSATEGTVFSPFTNTNGETLAISHVDVCGTGSTTTHTTDTTLTTTLPNTTVTTTGPNTTSTVTEPNTSTTVTEPNTTTTVTEPNTTSTITGPPVTTTTTGPDTTLTTTVPCLQQEPAVTPKSLTTITIGGTTITQTTPGSTDVTTIPGTTGTVTEPGSTVTNTVPGSTDVTTVPGSTVVSTVEGSTNTSTVCTTTSTSSTEGTTTTGGTEATTTSGGSTSNVAGTTKKKNGGNGNGAAAVTAENASGGLPFTGLHVPLLILIGLGMAATGVVLKRRLGGLE